MGLNGVKFVSILQLDKEKSRGRSLRKLNIRLSDVLNEIDKRISQDTQIHVLEVGCGYGIALLELSYRYGGKVCLHGISRTPEHGDISTMKTLAVKKGLFSEREVENIIQPQFHYFDACKQWPLTDNIYDVIFSQHAFLWFEDKIKALEEINRVMKNDGIALLDLSIRQTGPIEKSSIVIQNGNKSILFFKYLQQFSNIKYIKEKKSLWRYFYRLIKLRKKIPHKRGVLEMKKTQQLDFNLEFVSAKPFTYSGRKGYQSFYRYRTILSTTENKINH